MGGPLLFSYGSLQELDVQLATFGRALDGAPDELVGWQPSLVLITDAAVAARLGRTHHANVTFTGREEDRVAGTVFEVTPAELAKADDFEAEFLYVRAEARLASGRAASIYVSDDR